jgi:hypothetical protein
MTVAGAAVALLAGRFLHELGDGRHRRALAYALLMALLAISSHAASAWMPQTVATPHAVLLAGRQVQAMDGWWMQPALSIVVLCVLVLMRFTASAAAGRFGWTVGWLCGLLLAIAGTLGVFGWLVGGTVPVATLGMAQSAAGSLAMVTLGFGAMQLGSAALRRHKQHAVWLPALAAILLAGATVVAWRAVEQQESALRDERVALAVERTAGGIREAVVARTEALGRIATALRLADPARREALFDLEAERYARDHPGAVAVFLAGPDRVAGLVHLVERVERMAPGLPVAFDAQREAAYAEAEARARAVMLGPLELAASRGLTC